MTTYMQENSVTGASDAYAAVSLDDGETWKRYNISESADKSSFNVDQGGGWGGGGGCDDTDHDNTDDADDGVCMSRRARSCQISTATPLKATRRTGAAAAGMVHR